MNAFLTISVAILLLVLISTTSFARHDLPSKTYDKRCNDVEVECTEIKSKSMGDHQEYKKTVCPLQMAAGSRLPDCSHACGSCIPCRLVAVGIVCSAAAHSEPCPISYRCLCNGKSYPIP